MRQALAGATDTKPDGTNSSLLWGPACVLYPGEPGPCSLMLLGLIVTCVWLGERKTALSFVLAAAMGGPPLPLLRSRPSAPGSGRCVWTLLSGSWEPGSGFTLLYTSIFRKARQFQNHPLWKVTANTLVMHFQTPSKHTDRQNLLV